MNKGIVTAGHERTATAAAEILRSGGNAFDAAIAAMYATCIAEPALASLGGGGFLMAFQRDSAPILFDFFVQTPHRHKPPDEIDSRSFICDFGSAQQEFMIGSGTSAVPGYVKGIFEVAQRYSTMPMTELVQPALDLLNDDIVVNEMQAHIFKILTPIYLSLDARDIYESRKNPGNTIEPGETIHFPQYTDLLETLAIEGMDLFYRGEIAKAIHEISQQGGLVDYSDMAAYSVELRTPLKVHYSGYDVFLNPKPSSGGILIALGLTRLNALDMRSRDFGTLAHLTAMLETMAACNKVSENPEHGECDLDTELKAIYRKILDSHAQATRGTTHISVIDRFQNAVSVSVSNGEGCGTLIPGTPVMMNNMLGEHDVNPDGLLDWPANTRLSSMMSPTVAMSHEGGLIATGSGGSNRIPTAIQQVLVNLIDFGMSVEDAVRAPRLHHHQGASFLENLFNASVIEQFSASYPNCTHFDRRDVYFGGVHTAKYCNGDIEGFGDDRRGGVAIAV